jgi:membrane protein
MQFIINKTRYNFLYGTLGDAIFLLVNVYFFFIFFFMGGQFAQISDSLDVLLFSNLVKSTGKISKKEKSIWNKLFYSATGKLEKYLRYYGKGELIFTKGDSSADIYYLLNGSVEVLFNDDNTEKSSFVLDAGVFFGEMGYLLSENRIATVRAKTSIAVLVLPPQLFDEALKLDTDIDRVVIENLTKRLKNANV